MLSRAEADGLITRTMDEADRRVQRISLSDKGQKVVTEMENIRNLDAQKKTACLTEEEKEQFCLLCNKLSAHMERLALDLPEDRRMPPPDPDFPPRAPVFPHHGPDSQDGEKPRKPDHQPFPPGGRFKC